MTALEELKLSAITPAPDNPRRELGDLTELSASMAELGVLQPLVVTPRNGGFMVVCGHRRHAAAKKAKLATVPALVRDLDEPQRIKAMLVENCQRADLSPIEEARAYEQLVELGLSQRQIAGDVGKGQSHVSKRLALLKLPKKVLAKVDSGGIAIGDALELADLAEHPSALEHALKRVGQWGWKAKDAVRDARQELDRLKKRDEEIERVKASGVPYVAMKDDGYYGSLPKGTMRVDPDRSWDSLPIRIGAHSKLACHAATVDPRGTRVYLCTDPKSHAGEIKEAKDRATKDAAEQRRRAHEKAMREAREQRRSFVSDLISSRLPKDEVVAAIVDGFMSRAEAEARKVACQLLELEKDEARGWYGVLEAYAAKGAGEKLRAGLALAVATREIRLNSEWITWGDDEKAYFDLLATHGYETTASERLELAGKKPR